MLREWMLWGVSQDAGFCLLKVLKWQFTLVKLFVVTSVGSHNSKYTKLVYCRYTCRTEDEVSSLLYNAWMCWKRHKEFTNSCCVRGHVHTYNSHKVLESCNDAMLVVSFKNQQIRFEWLHVNAYDNLKK